MLPKHCQLQSFNGVYIQAPFTPGFRSVCQPWAQNSWAALQARGPQTQSSSTPSQQLWRPQSSTAMQTTPTHSTSGHESDSSSSTNPDNDAEWSPSQDRLSSPSPANSCETTEDPWVGIPDSRHGTQAEDNSIKAKSSSSEFRLVHQVMITTFEIYKI